MRPLLLAALICAILSVESLATVPTSITVQGRVTDAGGAPLAPGPKSFLFRIFDASVGGTQVWPNGAAENQTITTSTEGLWIGMVGADSVLTDLVFADTLRWLEITVEGTTLPRVRFLTGPYSYRVSTVDGASGGTITSKLSVGPGHFNGGTNDFIAGESNQIYGNYGTVTGGKLNVIFDQAATISGGVSNSAQGDSTSIGGGAHNTVNGVGSTVGGGTRNATTGEHNVVAGGKQNNAFIVTPGGGYAVIGGGNANVIAATHGVIGGGLGNRVNAALGTIGGGSYDTTHGPSATVAGGYNNVASGDYSTIAGGYANDAVGSTAAIGGGSTNRATYMAVVGGGKSNVADGNWSSVLGGEENLASGTYSTVLGGVVNTASGSWATVVGGAGNAAAGNASVAMGHSANATHNYDFVWNGEYDVNVYSDTSNQFKVHAPNGVNYDVNAGASKNIRMGDHYRDNGIVAWAKVNANGTVAAEFGVSSVLRLGIGWYQIYTDVNVGLSGTLLPVATVVTTMGSPGSAATARLIYVAPLGPTSFYVYVTDGNHVAIDNGFNVMVTAR